MNNARIRKAEAILSKMEVKAAPLLSNVIVYTDESDRKRQLASWRAKGGKRVVVMLPDNGMRQIIDGKPVPFRCP